MAEIPLVYPNHAYQLRRYVVDGMTRGLFRDEIPPYTSALDDVATPIFEDALPGSASVSELELRGRMCLLTTCAKMEDPEILSVSLSSAATASDFTSPTIVELDYRQLELQSLVSVAAFSQDSSVIRLVMVDCQGTFVTILLTDQLAPVEAQVDVAKTTDYIAELPVLQAITGSELQSTMIAFASPTTAIVALSPFLITVDLANTSSYIWSETQCLEDMKARSSSFGTLLTNFSDILLGRLNEGVMDMSPTAALCLTTTPNPLLDATYCVTLHSDASIRKWKIDVSLSPLPLEVQGLDATKLPLPSKWSDVHNSVSLCARMYDQTYAIGVHIKTEGFLTHPGSFPEEATDNTASDCHLWVFHGTNQVGSRDHCMPLMVPKEALSLVGMSFSPTASRCTLSVLFEATDREHKRTGTMHVTYPPSIMSIVSPEPRIVGHGSLDKVANRERARIRSLLFGPSLMDDMKDATIEEILHEMDSSYLKYLFRPMFPRGTGTVLPPTAGCIRRALAKLVHGSSKTKKSGMSIELELIRNMYEWRKRDHRQLVVALTPMRNKRSSTPSKSPALVLDDIESATPYSVYDAFVRDDGDDEEDMDVDTDIDGIAEEDWEKTEQERSSEIEAHEKRWRRLLLQVWEEEHVNRMPLLVKWLTSQSLQVLVRSGLITVMEEQPHYHEDDSGSRGALLDHCAIKLLERIEQDHERSSRLYEVEQQICTIIAKAQLALEPLGKTFVESLTSLARSAWSEADGVTDEDQDRVEDTLRGLSPSRLFRWIQETPNNSTGALPGLEIMIHNGEQDDSGKTWSQRQVANYQLRHSSCALAVRCIDSVRRLQLSRCLLLLDMVEGSQARDAALRAYLHSIAVLWVSSQRVPMPLTTFQTRKPIRLGEGSPDTSSPPNKRLSFGDDATSILANITSTMTSSLDVMIIAISQTMDSTCTVPLSPVGIQVFLASSYMRHAFSARGDVPIGKPSLLPELGTLPRPKDDTIATDYPRLALRLLAPYVAYSLSDDSADVVLARKESLAQCLLIESHTAAVGPLQVRMRQIACELLVPESPSYENAVDQRMITTAFDALQSLKMSMPVAQVANETLASALRPMIPSGTSIEITRLCELETVKSLFTPLVVGKSNQMDHVTEASIRLLTGVMLHLSRVMHRLTILERHVNVNGSNNEGDSPDVLLAFISSAINEMSKTFPDEVCQIMPEYGKMWARLFHHSILAGHWRTAYSACVRNPKSEHRESSFRRLVRSMVDQGALSELLVLCTELGQRMSSPSSLTSSESQEAVDLHEIASEILAEAVSRDIYAIRAASSEPTGLSDYQGALYALHASQKHWRRAAQSMDLRFRNAQRALGAQNQGFDYSMQLIELRDGLIVEDLVLASVGSLNAIELVTDNAHKFLVSGEYGPYNKIPVDDLGDDSSDMVASSKRTRGRLGVVAEEKSAHDEDRLSNFLTRVELSGRAIRCIALRSLFFDRSTDPLFAKSAFLRQIDSSKSDIDTLFQFGYFHYGLLLAKAWAMNREAETGSCRPAGSDLFIDCLCHMLEVYLMPNVWMSPKANPRPTLEQLHFSLDGTLASSRAASYIVPERHRNATEVRTSAVMLAAMSLVRKLTLAYTSTVSPVAIEVASMYLENGINSLPAWLEAILMGAGTVSPNGLFAPRPRSGAAQTFLGDPTALLNLYAKHGMLAEACTVVSSTLLAVHGDDENIESRAVSRLPEKGDIDFLPYKSVDMLWNLVGIVLSKRVLGAAEEKKVRVARDTMGAALEKYFASLKISETGMRSARALRK